MGGENGESLISKRKVFEIDLKRRSNIQRVGNVSFQAKGTI